MRIPRGLQGLKGDPGEPGESIKITAGYDCSLDLPANSTTPKYYLCTVSGNGATVGQLLYDNGSNTGFATIVSPANGDAIILLDDITDGALSDMYKFTQYVWDGASWRDNHPQYLLIADSPVIVPTSLETIASTSLDSIRNKNYFGEFDTPKVTFTAGTHTLDLTNIRCKTLFYGDDRPLAGLTYSHGATIKSTATNAGIGTCSITNSGNDVVVTGATTNPDFTGWVSGDKIWIQKADKTFAEYTISSVSTNTITLTTTAPALNDIDATITLIPNRTISTAISLTAPQLQHFKGFSFTSTFTVASDVKFSNCVFNALAESIIANRGASVEFSEYENTCINGTSQIVVNQGSQVFGAISCVHFSTRGVYGLDGGNVDVSNAVFNAGGGVVAVIMAGRNPCKTHGCYVTGASYAYNSTGGSKITGDNSKAHYCDFGYFANHLGIIEGANKSTTGCSTGTSTANGGDIY